MLEEILSKAFEKLSEDNAFIKKSEEKINEIKSLQKDSENVFQKQSFSSNLSEDETKSMCDSIETLLNKIEEKREEIYGNN